MQLKYKMIFRPLGDNYVGVPVGKEAASNDAIVTINEVGHDIVELLKTPIEREELISKMLDVYETDHETMAQCVDMILQQLRNEDLLNY